MALILSPVVYVESFFFFFPNKIILNYRGNFGSGYLFNTAVLSKKRCRCFSKDKSNFLNFRERKKKNRELVKRDLFTFSYSIKIK